jgi:hypothetical protein
MENVIPEWLRMQCLISTAMEILNIFQDRTFSYVLGENSAKWQFTEIKEKNIVVDIVYNICCGGGFIVAVFSLLSTTVKNRLDIEKI